MEMIKLCLMDWIKFMSSTLSFFFSFCQMVEYVDLQRDKIIFKILKIKWIEK